jgi:hypothetical protein
MNDSTVRKALEILYKHKGLDNFRLTSFTIDRMNNDPFIYGDWKMNINVPATIKIEATITVDHTSWYEYLDVDYLFTERDLTDTGEVNKVIGDISKFDSDTKEILRLAYILFDGYNYAAKRIQHKDFHPRVVRVNARF